jgi:hypothetical protein
MSDTAFQEKDLLVLFPGRKFEIGKIRVTTAAITKILNEIALTGVMYKACIATGVSPLQFLRLRKENNALELLASEAKEIYREHISQVVHHRAIEGWEEPVFYQGREVGTVRKYSDRLLEMQARRHIPEYRESTQMDVNVVAGVLVVSAPATLDQAEWLENAKKVKRLPTKDVVDG